MQRGREFEVKLPEAHIAVAERCGKRCARDAAVNAVQMAVAQDASSVIVESCQAQVDCAGPTGHWPAWLRRTGECGALVVASCYDPELNLAAEVRRLPFDMDPLVRMHRKQQS